MAFGPELRRGFRSTGRLTLVLSAFVTLLLIGASALSFVLINHTFDHLALSTARDLEEKAQRSASELVRRTAAGVQARDLEQIAGDVAVYAAAEDVEAIVVADGSGQVLFQRGPVPPGIDVFAGPPEEVVERSDRRVAWAQGVRGEASAGKVAVVVSGSRLQAGEQLRRRVIGWGAAGALVALVSSLSFVVFYVGRRVRSIHRFFAELESQARGASDAARLKGELLANVSHEIRTPMNGVIGMTQLLKTTRLTGEQQRYVDAVDRSAHALLSLVNDVLDAAKTEAGQFELREATCDVRGIVEDVAELIAPAANAKGVEVLGHVHELPKFLVCDGDRLRQVLVNIAGNAVKFTERGHVLIRARWDERAGTLEFVVEDTGIGIAPEHQATIFSAFCRGDDELARRYEGTGLGLAISKRLIELMGGTLSVDTRVGEGSRFRFTIAATRAADAVVEEPPLGLRVLLVEPSVACRDVLRDVLEAWGCSVLCAQDLREAEKLVARSTNGARSFDVCLLAYDVADARDVDPRDLFACGGKAPRVVRIRSWGAPVRSEDEQTVTRPFRLDELRRSLDPSIRGEAASPRASSLSRGIEAERDAMAQGARALIVEDDPINQEVLRAMLDRMGIECDVVATGHGALEKLRTESYAVVLMDCQMPTLDGYETTRRLRSWPDQRSRTPVIAVTAHATSEEEAKAAEAGMHGYVSKPVTMAALIRALEPWVGASGEVDSRLQAGACLEPDVRRSPAVRRLFVSLAPQQVRSIRSSVETDDAAQRQQVAHRLKGSCQAIGATRMAELCAQLERTSALELVERLERELELVCAALREESEELVARPMVEA